MPMVEFINPPTLHANPAFSQAVVIPAGAATVIVGGQNAVDVEGNVIGDDIAAQAVKAIDNLEAALAAAGCSLDDLVLCRIYFVAGHDVQAAFGAWMKKRGRKPNPPAVVGLFVQALANPKYLIEIEGLAVKH
jgi:enamine deaminase RidA (YjgF/YER057c/UK114 family)